MSKLTFLVAACFTLAACVSAQLTTQANVDRMAAYLRITWLVATNTEDFDRYRVEVTLENTSPALNLDNDPWQLYFNCRSMVEPDMLGVGQMVELPGQGVNVTHVQGGLFYFTPNGEFLTLVPGEKRKIKFKVSGWSVARTDTLNNWYLVSPDPALRDRTLQSTVGESLSFVGDRTRPEQWKRFGSDTYNPYTPQDRYDRNFVTFPSLTSEFRVIPKPLNVAMAQGESLTYLQLDDTWKINYVGNDLHNEGNYTQRQQEFSRLVLQNVVTDDGQAAKVILLQIGTVDVEGTSLEAYRLVVDSLSQRITVTGRGAPGVFYGIVTLLSLMEEDRRVPDCVITDTPRFPYRGLMLDIARNFYGKDQILKIISLMSTYKMNQLRLHLSDDESWRLEIPSLPELVALGARQCHDPTETTCLMPQLGSGGSSSLTSQDYQDIVTQAKDHHVTIVPEVDMPGHARAAIKSMELRQRIAADPQEGLKTVLVTPGEVSGYVSPELYTDGIMNPCLDSTYTFIAIIMDELVRLHELAQQPLATFHMGGDGKPAEAWLNSTSCHTLKDSGVLGSSSLTAYFNRRVNQLASDRNLSVGLWEDSLMEQGNQPFPPSEDVDVYAYTWDSVWEEGTTPRTYNLANSGYKVVMSHGSHLSLDHTHEPDPEERGSYTMSRFTDTRKSFSYSAERFYDNFDTSIDGTPIPEGALCGMNNQSCPPLTAPENIIGMEAVMFTDIIRTEAQLQEMMFPRLLAVAERAWHEAEWERLPKSEEEREKLLSADWFSFARAVGRRELKRLDAQAVTYRIPPPGAKVQFGRLLTTPLYPGLTTEYSVNGGTTWSDGTQAVSLEDSACMVWLRSRSVYVNRYSRTVVLNQNLPLSVVNQPVVDYIADNVTIMFTVEDNYKTYGDRYYIVRLDLTNSGNETIPGGNWKIYFTAVQWIQPDQLIKGLPYTDHDLHLTLDHVKGYLFSVGPANNFPGIAGNEKLSFVYKSSGWSVSRYEQMPNWYVSAPGMTAKTIRSTQGEELSFVSDFTTPQQWKRMSYDQFDPWTPGARHDRNEDRSVTPVVKSYILPTPMTFNLGDQPALNLSAPRWVVYSHASLKDVVDYFIDNMLKRFPGVQLTSTDVQQSDPYIQFSLADLSAHTNSSEAYTIRTYSNMNGVNVTAASTAGAFYGAVSLIHMALKAEPRGMIPDCEVTDWPRYPYRGMHVDSARNFVHKASVLKLLEVMALYKLNKLHFHITDDEAWRLQIPGLEELTSVGGRRCHDFDETTCIMSTMGSGPDSNKNSGSGYYTVEDYREILRFANARHIEVIPEFDMPGHSHAAIKAMRARQRNLQDKGQSEKGKEFLLTEPYDRSQYFSVQFYNDNAINPCLESTYSFIEHILREVQKMHQDIQPLRVFNYGGDEVARGAWLNVTSCADKIANGESMKREFAVRVSQITRNLTLAAWEDGVMDHASVPWNRSLFPNPEVIAYSWQTVWEWGTGARAHNLANGGYQLVLVPVTHTYLDHPQEPSPEERGFYWGTRYTDAYKTFSFMPDDYYMNAEIKRSGEPITLDEICEEDNSGCPPLTHPENVIGIQGALWSETVRQPDQFDYMVYPRLLALSERAWHKADWEGQDKTDRKHSQNTDWSKFASSLGTWDLAILDDLGVTYRVPPPGARQHLDKIEVSPEFPGLGVQFKISSPGRDWQELQPDQTFAVGQEVNLRTVSADGKRFSTEVKITVQLYSTSASNIVSASGHLLLFIAVLAVTITLMRMQ